MPWHTMVAIATYSAWHKNSGMALDEEEKHSVCSLLSSRFGLLVQLLLNVMVNGAGHVAHNVFHHENKILHGLAIKGTTNEGSYHRWSQKKFGPRRHGGH